MKKLAIGCGILLVVLLVGGAVGHAISSTTRSSPPWPSLRPWARFRPSSGECGTRAAFTPPESGELTEAQVARYLKVQDQVRTLLGSRFDEFKTKYAELSKRMDKDQGTVFDAPAVVGAYRDLARTYVDAKKAQVEALNAAELLVERVSVGATAGLRRRRHAGDGLRRLEDHRRRDIGQDAPAAAAPRAWAARSGRPDPRSTRPWSLRTRNSSKTTRP